MKVLLRDEERELTAEVSDCDYARAVRAATYCDWKFSFRKGGFGVSRKVVVGFANPRYQSLALFILGKWLGHVKYIDGNPLNCQRENLKLL